MIELPLPPGLERETIKTPDGPVVAWRARSATRLSGTVIMVPGLGETKEDYRVFLPVLAAAGYDAWAYDQPGEFGQPPDSHPDRYTIPCLAGQLRQIINAVGHGEPVHLVGHCLGGFVARDAVLADPDVASTLTLLACGPSVRESHRRAALNGLSNVYSNGGPIGLWPLIKRTLAEDDQIMREYWYAKLATMNTHFVDGATGSMMEEPDRSADLIAAGIRSLVVHGKRDKRPWSANEYAAMARVLKADLVVIDKAGHRPHREQPESTGRALLDFWSATAGKAAAGKAAART